ncbi:MAG: alpha/beta hydrolase fold domain-containing protein [Ilumatobacteraceae bacterium]
MLGDHQSDDPFCRDLCVRSNALIVSCNYRHAPEHRFHGARPRRSRRAAVGERPRRRARRCVRRCGDRRLERRRNIAAVTAQRARDAGGPRILGQLLLTSRSPTAIARDRRTWTTATVTCSPRA